jgi:hypothetical protein
MPWADVIASILKVLGPILSDLLKRWLDGKLKAAAKSIEEPTGDTGTDVSDLLIVALTLTPRRQTFRRAFLRHAIDAVPGAVAAGKLNSADRKELTALAGTADQE